MSTEPKGETRLSEGMTVSDAIKALMEGNAGAGMACLRLHESTRFIDPDSTVAAAGPFATLDYYGIYGWRIWVLFKDVCGKDVVKLVGVLRAVQLGHVPGAALMAATDGNPTAINVDAAMARVRAELPGFMKGSIVG